MTQRTQYTHTGYTPEADHNVISGTYQATNTTSETLQAALRKRTNDGNLIVRLTPQGEYAIGTQYPGTEPTGALMRLRAQQCMEALARFSSCPTVAPLQKTFPIIIGAATAEAAASAELQPLSQAR